MNVLLSLLVTALTTLSVTNAGDTANNDLVDVRVEVTESTFRPGTAAHFLISFRPKKGINITTDPAFEFSFDTLKQFFSAGKATFVKDAKGYLKPQQPVKQQFAIAKQTPPGSYRVRGTLVYYYCSDAEGWCSRFRQPVELTFVVQ